MDTRVTPEPPAAKCTASSAASGSNTAAAPHSLHSSSKHTAAVATDLIRGTTHMQSSNSTANNNSTSYSNNNTGKDNTGKNTGTNYSDNTTATNYTGTISTGTDSSGYVQSAVCCLGKAVWSSTSSTTSLDANGTDQFRTASSRGTASSSDAGSAYDPYTAGRCTGLLCSDTPHMTSSGCGVCRGSSSTVCRDSECSVGCTAEPVDELIRCTLVAGGPFMQHTESALHFANRPLLMDAQHIAGTGVSGGEHNTCSPSEDDELFQLTSVPYMHSSSRVLNYSYSHSFSGALNPEPGVLVGAQVAVHPTAYDTLAGSSSRRRMDSAYRDTPTGDTAAAVMVLSEYDLQEEWQGSLQSVQRGLYRYFEIAKRESTIRQEVRAGLILYATMCYIIVVNPEILSVAGFEKGGTASTTAVCGMVLTLLLGLFANLPFGAAPGMGLNTMFACELVEQNGWTGQQALAACFVAGCAFLLLAMTGLSTYIVAQVPVSLKKSVVVSIGMLQTVVCLSSMGFIRAGKYSFLESVTGKEIWHSSSMLLFIFTVCLMSILIMLKVPASILVGLIISFVVSLVLKVNPTPESVFSTPKLEIGTFDFSRVFTRAGSQITLLVFIVLFLDTGGVVAGVAAQADVLLTRPGGECINSSKAFISVGVGIMLTAFFGTSPPVIFLESAAAVNQGGRTGLTAVVAAVLLGVSTFFVPLVRVMPAASTSPVLLLVGSFMMGGVLGIPWHLINEALPSFVTIVVTAFSCSISQGITSGFMLYIILNAPQYAAKSLNWKWLLQRLSED